jgi:hypothetical protein
LVVVDVDFLKNELVHLKNKEKLEKMKIHKEYNIEIEELQNKI